MEKIIGESPEKRSSAVSRQTAAATGCYTVGAGKNHRLADMRDGGADQMAVHENGHAVIPEAEPKEVLHFEVFALRCYAF